MDANYTAILQMVLDDTKRPDKQDVILRRISRGILRYHRMDFWKRDHTDQIYNFDNTVTAAVTPTLVTGGNALFMNQFPSNSLQNFIQVLDTVKLGKFRNFSYVRKFKSVDAYGVAILDPVSGQQGTVAGGDLKERSPDSMFDGYGYDIDDCYYWSGSKINIRSSTPLAQVYIGYFTDPVIDNVNFTTNSWIARDYQDLVAADCKQKIFGDIGKYDEKKSALEELRAEVLLLQTNNVKVSQR